MGAGRRAPVATTPLKETLSSVCIDFAVDPGIEPGSILVNSQSHTPCLLVHN